MLMHLYCAHWEVCFKFNFVSYLYQVQWFLGLNNYFKDNYILLYYPKLSFLTEVIYLCLVKCSQLWIRLCKPGHLFYAIGSVTLYCSYNSNTLLNEWIYWLISKLAETLFSSIPCYYRFVWVSQNLAQRLTGFKSITSSSSVFR